MKSLWLLLLPLSAFCQANEMVVRYDSVSDEHRLRFDGAHTYQVLDVVAGWQDIAIAYVHKKPDKTITGEYPLQDFICVLDDLRKKDPSFTYCIARPTDRITVMYIYKPRKHWWQFYRLKDGYSLYLDRDKARELRRNKIKFS